MKLQGVDNGRLWFHNVRVPRQALLNRFADVSPAGRYTSSIPSVSSRFGPLSADAEVQVAAIVRVHSVLRSDAVHVARHLPPDKGL